MKDKSRIVIFVLVLLSMTLINLFSKDKVFSERENRLLAQFPSLSLKSFMDGSYNSKFEVYASDQFLLRDSWTGLKTRMDLLLLKKDNTRVYYGKDDFLFDVDKILDNNRFEKNMESINTLKESISKPMDIVLIPSKSNIYPDKLPYKAPVINETVLLNDIKKALDEDISVLSMMDCFVSKNNEDLYYKTDHHYTSLGAYYTYKEYIESIGLEAYPLSSFNQVVVSKDFLGSLFRKSNYYAGEPEEILKFEIDDDITIHVNGTDERIELYDSSYLEKSDKYSYFLGGDHPLLEITTSQKGSGTLVIVKDSFANSVIPFLTLHFENIIVIDERYYNLPLKDLLDTINYDRILYLFNQRTFYDR